MIPGDWWRPGTRRPSASRRGCAGFYGQRRNGGAVHKETIYAQPTNWQQPDSPNKGSVTQKVPLTSLTLKDVDKLIDPHRNEKLYAAIRERLAIGNLPKWMEGFPGALIGAGLMSIAFQGFAGLIH